MIKQFFALSLISVLAACTPEIDHQADENKIIISDAWVRPPMAGRDVAVAYFTLTNQGKPDQLLSVSSPLSDMIELHTHLHENGVMKMRRVTAVDVPKGDLAFEPGSFHVMMFGVALSADQNDAKLTLNFVKHDPLTIIAEIRSSSNRKTD